MLFLLFGGIFQLFNGLLSPEGTLRLIIAFPLLFAFVAVYHGCTGRWARTNHRLRQTSLTVLWVLAFYIGYLALLCLLIFGAPPSWGEPLLILIFFSPFAGGLAGSLCWRGKLPGTRKVPEGRTDTE